MSCMSFENVNDFNSHLCTHIVVVISKLKALPKVLVLVDHIHQKNLKKVPKIRKFNPLPITLTHYVFSLRLCKGKLKKSEGGGGGTKTWQSV